MLDPNKAYLEVMNLVCDYNRKRQVPIDDAVGKILADKIIAPENVPPFERSPYDGYAFRSEETSGARQSSPVIFQIAATQPAGGKLERIERGKKAVKIMTGASLPNSYDCVIPFEEVKVENDNVFLTRELSVGENVIPCGEDIKLGEFLLTKGKMLSSRDIGVLSSLGYKQVEVMDPPRVGIIVTGNELVDLDKKPGKGEIRNSNKYILTASLKELNIERIIYYGIVEDSREKLKDMFKRAFEEVDILITTGGVSVGEYDLIPEVLNEMGAKRIFWRINARPGTPLHVARYGDVTIFSLSGNPAALYASYKVFVEKAFLKMLGLIKGDSIFETAVKGYLGKNISKKVVNQWRFIRARGYIDEGKLWCLETKKEKPGIISSLVISNGFIILSLDDQLESKSSNKDVLVYFMPFDYGKF